MGQLDSHVALTEMEVRGAETFSITTLSIMTFEAYAECNYGNFRSCCVSLCLLPFILSVTTESSLMSVVVLNVIMINVVRLSVIIVNVVALEDR